MHRFMHNGLEYSIREASVDEWDYAMELAFRVFLKFEAEEYGKQGTEEFARFVTDPMLKKMFVAGVYKLFLAVKDNTIIGVLSLRGGNHISLLFIESAYHRQGIGTALVDYAQDYLVSETSYESMTVNSSPYGIDFYHACGFFDTGVQMKTDGIIYTPMELTFIHKI